MRFQYLLFKLWFDSVHNEFRINSICIESKSKSNIDLNRLLNVHDGVLVLLSVSTKCSIKCIAFVYST